MTQVMVFQDFVELPLLRVLLAPFEDVTLDVGSYCLGPAMGEDKHGNPFFGPQTSLASVGSGNIKVFGRDRVCVADTLITGFNGRCVQVPCEEGRPDRVVLRVLSG